MLALVVIAAVVVAWGITVREGFGRDRASVPLLLLGGALVPVVLVAPAAGAAGGLLQDWLARDPLPGARRCSTPTGCCCCSAPSWCSSRPAT